MDERRSSYFDEKRQSSSHLSRSSKLNVHSTDRLNKTKSNNTMMFMKNSNTNTSRESFMANST